MATYTAFKITPIITAARTVNRTGILLAGTPTTKELVDKIAYASVPLTTARSSMPRTNSKSTKAGTLIQAQASTRESGVVINVNGVKYPRTTPLEICWTKANQ